MLASMSEIDPRMEMPPASWSEVGVSGLLPTGIVSLLLADVEGSTRLWETQPEEMTTALARLNQAVNDIVAAHNGVRPVEQGEGDSFVAAFARASDAVAAALELQRAPLAPIRLRIGIHVGEIQLRDEGNYAGPTINRTARLRDLAHGGQTVLSGAAEELVAERLPAGAWLADLGSHTLRDLPRPERVLQLCHPDLVNEFPPLRASKGGKTVALHNLPPQLTSFVGRAAELGRARELLADNRLVTLTGAGGVGKTRLAVEIANRLAGEFADGVCYVDLAPLTDPDVVPIAVARAFGLSDQPGRSTMDALIRFVAGRQMLVVLDNCEHLLDASAELIIGLLGAAPGLTLLATSREPIDVAGEVGWRVPSLPLADEAIELFTDRARRARPEFAVNDGNVASVTEICRRLDGLPLAIELAAARVRALSLTEIVDTLHDRFRLLTGGARTAVRRQQTLRGSVDWSHALLTSSERILFRRLAVFLGGFDLVAAQAVAGFDDVEHYQVLDLLSLLVDKSLVLADDSRDRTRYRLLETVRQYAQEKLAESGEGDKARSRHRDHFTSLAIAFDAPAGTDYEQQSEQIELNFDNMRAAFAWSRENGDTAQALTLVSSLQPLWIGHGRIREGLAMLDTVLTQDIAEDAGLPIVVRARALADKAFLESGFGSVDCLDQAQQALTLARAADDDAVLTRVLTACGFTAAYNAELAGEYFAEANELARKLDDKWRLSQILSWSTSALIATGDPLGAQAAAEEGRDLADAIGDRFNSRQCRMCLGLVQIYRGDAAGAVSQLREVVAEARSVGDALKILEATALAHCATALSWTGDVDAARAAAEESIGSLAEIGGIFTGVGFLSLANVGLAAGDAGLALDAATKSWDYGNSVPGLAVHVRPARALSLWASGELIEARRWADAAVATSLGWAVQTYALTVRAHVAIAQSEPEQALRDAHDALACMPNEFFSMTGGDALECLATLAADSGSYPEAVRLFGAAAGIRGKMGIMRIKVWDACCEASIAGLRNVMSEQDFESAWAEGAALSPQEAVAYAQRGRGERKRPSSGWGSLTRTELDVVRLVTEGLGNNDIATRLFVSPRTVQSHLTHVYSKLGLNSRVQLAQEAARHAD
ncbi:LuxR family transcriptional regulator [Mycobacterium intermedium]|uniref:LuxR family transcriptional regulator n=1 Tax=Mycobacterium intermedium TaxID=28445 RepID=A0A1T3W1J3_MYCIE|nr:LuxR family transcriptional regulator [Mycobacterium intermedium]MCV6962594.1 LuxR family transcriptional regulator [Mycobacterium intermedium]OPE48266.1 LuxR family transcriptional regulator [Mycobacterium intermedium]ORA95670.1 LuxR family transcriptional regulator [Mycobacterium intermedium]